MPVWDTLAPRPHEGTIGCADLDGPTWQVASAARPSVLDPSKGLEKN